MRRQFYFDFCATKLELLSSRLKAKCYNLVLYYAMIPCSEASCNKIAVFIHPAKRDPKGNSQSLFKRDPPTHL